jgi:hypothetical protein
LKVMLDANTPASTKVRAADSVLKASSSIACWKPSGPHSSTRFRSHTRIDRLVLICLRD